MNKTRRQIDSGGLMIALSCRHDATAGAWMIGKWHDCHGHPSPLQFHDSGSAAVWLRGFESDDLRRIALRHDDSTPLSRLTDHAIVELLAGLIVSGVLWVFRPAPEHGEVATRSGTGHEFSAEHKIIRRLRVTAEAFDFEGDRLRIVSANQWSSLRADDDARYQVVPRDAAQLLLRKVSQWPAISTDERQAIKEAITLIQDAHPLKVLNGILLLRSIARFGNVASARRDAAFTPSQLAGRRREVELHWIQIELVDAADQPVPNEPYELELPDGEMRRGALDSNGQAYIGDIKVSGPCRVCFPAIDAKEWRVA